MGRLIFAMAVSLDGYVETPERSLDWVLIDDDLHRAFNDGARRIGISLYGRRMYELMMGYWPTAADDPDAPPAIREFAEIWAGIPRVVVSRTLETVDPGSRLVRDDVVEEVRRLKAASDLDLDVGGPGLASTLFEHDLIDEVQLYLHPIVLGGGTRFFPPLDRPRPARLTGTRTFASGVVLVRYELGAT